MNRKTTVRSIVALLSVAIFLILLWPGAYSGVHGWYERTILRWDPSAHRAYEFGDMHFDARDRALYDLDRAHELYNIALERDPSLLGARHQIGRIYFVRGELKAALQYLSAEISMAERSAKQSPSSYYMRGLIEGFMGDYTAAARDYEVFLESNPDSWAGQNDYAWVLLKEKRYEEALKATEAGLKHFESNPWLLNSKATALYELGRYEEALAAAAAAVAPASTLPEEWWHKAYPGNHPNIARLGIQTLQDAIATNMHSIELKLTAQGIQ